MGALDPNLFTMIVAMAVITTMAMPPTPALDPSAAADQQRGKSSGSTARRWKPRGFVPKLEQLLLAEDRR